MTNLTEKVSKKDKLILGDLGRKLRAIAELPVQNETIKLWKALNGLKPVRPMVMIDQLPWHELNTDNELSLLTEDPFCREVELNIRKQLYQWKHFRVDSVVLPEIYCPLVIEGIDFGVNPDESVAVGDPKNSVVGHFFEDCLKDEEALEKIKMPHIELNEPETNRRFEILKETFSGIIDVRKQGYQFNFHVWDEIVVRRGAENLLLDLSLRPEFTHKVISRFSDFYLSMLDQMEEKGLLGFGFPTIHCTGAFSDELPAAGFNPDKPRAKDNWAYGAAQIFSTVSPAMHEEFEIEYAKKWFSKFGLGYYGCCEPLHKKIGIIRKLPNIRKISMSPWVDQEEGALNIGKDYVFSRKTSPAYFSRESFDLQALLEDAKETKKICVRSSSPLEFILKDVSTVNYEPKRLETWAEGMMALVKK